MSGQNPNDQTVDDIINGVDNAKPEAPQYDEHSLERMTESERAALLSEDEEEAADQEAEAAAAAEEAAKVEEAAKAEADAQAAKEADAAKEVASMGGQLEALTKQSGEKNSELLALRQSYDDGDLTSDEFDAKQKEIAAELSKIERQAGAIEGRMQEAKEADHRQWVNACKTFVSANPDFATEAHMQGFNTEVESVTSDPRFANMTFEQQLTVAAQRYAITVPEAGLTVGAAAPAPKKDAAPAADPKKPEKMPDALAKEVPPTLANVPAETIDPNESNIAALAARLDRETDPAKKEAIMGRLSEDMRRDVLSYAG